MDSPEGASLVSKAETKAKKLIPHLELLTIWGEVGHQSGLKMERGGGETQQVGI